MIRATFLILIVFLATACTPVERFSVTLNPSFYRLHDSGFTRATGPADLLLDRRGVGASPELMQWRTSTAGHGTLLVGFSNDVVRGPDPAPNNLWTWRVWQAKAFFDMEALPEGAIVREATLVFNAPLVDTDYRTYPQREGATNGCGLRIGSAHEPLTTGDSSTFGPASALPYRPARPGFNWRAGQRSVDITRTAFEWSAGIRPNNGLLFSPVDDAIETEDDTQYCAFWVSRPRLEVIFDVPVSP